MPNDAPHLHEVAARGVRAEQEFETLDDAFTALEAEYIEAWKRTPIDKAEARERLHVAVSMISHVRRHVVKVINDGTVAAEEIETIKTYGDQKDDLGVI